MTNVIRSVAVLVFAVGCTVAKSKHRDSDAGVAGADGGMDAGPKICEPVCSGTSPVCGSNGTCRGCMTHAECASNVCRPNGSCADANDVAYVDPTKGTDNLSCSQADPCTLLSVGLSTRKSTVKMTGTVSDNVSIASQNVAIFADPGTKLVGKVEGNLMTVAGNSQVEIFDLEITQGIGLFSSGIVLASGNTATVSLDRVTISRASAGISALGGTLNVTRSTFTDNQGAGISGGGSTVNVTQSTFGKNGTGVAAYGGTLRVSQSTFNNNDGPAIRVQTYFNSDTTVSIAESVVSGNTEGILVEGDYNDRGTLSLTRSLISNNAAGGVVMYCPMTFRIINNFITGNGTDTSSAGGLRLVPKDFSALEFNTIARNRVGGDYPRSGGVICDQADYRDPNNLDAPNNLIFGNINGADNRQVDGKCTYGNSFMGPDDPRFADEAKGNYHLSASTPAVVRDRVSCTGITDFDGDNRPKNGMCDLGADEF